MNNFELTNSGGWIDNTVSIEKTVRIMQNAVIIDNVKIEENARIVGNVIISGNAYIGGNSHIIGNSFVGQYACIVERACVSDKAIVRGNAYIGGNAEVKGIAEVLGNFIMTKGFVDSGQWKETPIYIETSKHNIYNSGINMITVGYFTRSFKWWSDNYESYLVRFKLDNVKYKKEFKETLDYIIKYGQ